MQKDSEVKVAKKRIFGKLITQKHTPDILDCIANLSSDEVFTPPEIANKVLDLLPESVWTNPDLRWLDPACKTGVFLREAAKRLMDGLADEIPDEEQRREHIFKNMLFGMPITRLTALMSRRSVYYAKNAISDKSVVRFDDPEGNIKFHPMEHTFKMGKCIYCGLSKKDGTISDRDVSGELENYAYEFIHLTEEEVKNMKFDIIVGNPPYNLDDGGHGASSAPIYQYFVEQAKKIQPQFLTLIIPSRWFAGGKGLDKFRDEMLQDKHIKYLVDYPNASDCFSGVEIKGGVCYFLRDENYMGDCRITTMIGEKASSTLKRALDENDTFVRWNEAIPILRKVQNKNEYTLDNRVSSRKPFGFPTNYKNFDDINNPDKVKIYANKQTGYVYRHNVVKNRELIDRYKVLLPKANQGSGIFPNAVLGQPILAGPKSVCTETYLVVNHFADQMQAQNFIKYIKTKFFRFLLILKKVTQDTTAKVYAFIPDLPMNHAWTDQELYKRYGLSEDEIDFIEKMIKEM